MSPLTTDQVAEISARLDAKCVNDAMARGATEEQAREYADAIAVYLAFAQTKCVDYCSTITTWDNLHGKLRNSFPRQAMAMTWDFAEGNPLVMFPRFVDAIADVLERLPHITTHAEIMESLNRRVEALYQQLDREQGIRRERESA